MSVRISSKVWEHSTRNGTELLMLLAIADFADDDGWAYPAIGTLATKTRMTPRNVNHILASLRDSGELEVHLNGGPRGTNRYRIRIAGSATHAQAITPEARFTPEAAFTLKPASSTPEVGFRKPLKPVSPEPSLNHQEPSVEAAAPPAPRKLSAEQSKTTKTRKPRPEQTTLEAWIDAVKRTGEMAIPKNDPIFDYAADIGLPTEYLSLAWRAFKRKYGGPQAKTGKVPTYADWRAHFRNEVRKNWGNLWRCDAHGNFVLTTAGEQERLLSEREAHDAAQ